MNTISITVNGTDLETINITLTDAEVKSLYESNKDLKAKLENVAKLPLPPNVNVSLGSDLYFAWIAQKCPSLVSAIKSIPSS